MKNKVLKKYMTEFKFAVSFNRVLFMLFDLISRLVKIVIVQSILRLVLCACGLKTKHRTTKQ